MIFHSNSSGILVQSVSFNDAFELVNMRLEIEQNLACVLKSNLQCKLLAIPYSSITCPGKTSFCFPEKVSISTGHALTQVLMSCSTQCTSTRPSFMLSDHLLVWATFSCCYYLATSHLLARASFCSLTTHCIFHYEPFLTFSMRNIVILYIGRILISYHSIQRSNIFINDTIKRPKQWTISIQY